MIFSQRIPRLFVATTSLCLSGVTAAADLVTYTEARQPCAERSETRRAFFGDLHIHTGYSYDALPLGTKTTPADAYGFAKGEPLPVPPYDEEGTPTGMAQLKVPLDFAAVTDHAEFFGEYARCQNPDSGVADLEVCDNILNGTGRGTWHLLQAILAEDPQRRKDICGEDGNCLEDSTTLWEKPRPWRRRPTSQRRLQFTAFVAYEYTAHPTPIISIAM